MNAKTAKKIRKMTRVNWREIKTLPFNVRLHIAWWLIFGRSEDL